MNRVGIRMMNRKLTYYTYLFKNGRRRIRGVVCSDKSDGRIYWILLMAREEMTLRTIQCCRDSCRFLQNGDGLVD